MNVKVVDQRFSQALGIPFRQLQSGPEQDLLNWFLREFPFSSTRGCRTTVFREPRLESGFPDMVVVVWRPDATRDWPQERNRLTTRDIRVLHFLAMHGPTTLDELRIYFSGGLAPSLDRLQSAKTIRRAGQRFSARALSRTFVVERILAFEAKVRGWSGVLAQASLNNWFASESFVLVPGSPQDDQIVRDAHSRGIGVWTQEKGCVSEPAVNLGKLPLSYASWLFNEWVWRVERLAQGPDLWPSMSIGLRPNSVR
jgi:hypothetical protein